MAISKTASQMGNFIANSEFWKNSFLPAIRRNWKNLVQRRVGLLTQRIPIKYRKIIRIGSGVLVILSPIIFRFIKRKNFVVYIIFGLAEIFAASFFEDEMYQKRIIPIK